MQGVKTPTAEQANATILNATYSVFEGPPHTALDMIVLRGLQHYGSGRYQLKAMKPDGDYVEFVLGDTTTNQIVTFFRKNAGSDAWRIYMYDNDNDVRDKKAVEVDLRDQFEPGAPRTPGIVNIVRTSDSTHDLRPLFEQLAQQQHQPGGRRRRRTRARKTHKRKTRRSRR